MSLKKYFCFFVWFAFSVPFSKFFSQAINNINLVVVNGDSIAQQEVRLLAPNGKATATGNLQSRLHIDKNIILSNSYQTSPNNAASLRGHDKRRPVGTIKGNAFVDQGGGANYSIKISSSPGTKGMTPDISVNYNHNFGDGQLGLGWSLGGISSIKKGNYTWFHDEKSGRFNETQSTWNVLPGTLTTPIYLDGQKMVPLSNSGTTNMYALFGDNQTRITYNTSGDFYLVELPNGKKMEYGRNSSSNGSILKINNKSIEWYLTKVYDNYGNYMEYYYHNIDKEIAIKEIKYTGNSSISMLPYNSVKFYYSKRSDARFHYLYNDSIKYKLLLREIETFCEGAPVFKYEFKYSFEDFNYLNEIIQHSGPDKFNSTAFVYGGLPGPIGTVQVANLLNGSGANSPVNNYVTADFNNDGKTDILEMLITGGAAAIANNGFFSYNGFKLYINNGGGNFMLTQSVNFPSGFYASAFMGNYGFLYGTQANPNGIQTGDINGDGYIDMVYATANFSNAQERLVAYQFNPTTNQLNNINLAPNYAFMTQGAPTFFSEVSNVSLMMGDFDGNGTSDILTITLAANAPSGTNEVKFFDFYNNQVDTIGNLAAKVYTGNINSFGNLYDYGGFSAADYDGDGVTDILCFKNIGTSTSRFSVLRKEKSPSKLFAEIAYFPVNSEVYPADHASPGDYNGDGYLDFISHRFLTSEQTGIFYGTGSSFTFPKKDNPALGYRGLNKKFLPIDVNSDGVTDLVKVEKVTAGVVNISAILGQNILTATSYKLYATIGVSDGVPSTCSMPPIKDYFHPYCDYDYDGNPTGSAGCFNNNTDPEDIFDTNANEIPFFSVGDFDGDGYNDVIMRSKCQSGTPMLIIIYFKHKYGNKFLTKVLDGMDLSTDYTYATTANNIGNHYTKSTTVYTYPNPRINFPKSIATSISYLNPANLSGSSVSQVFNYYYEDNIINLTGRGSIGFMNVKKKNMLTGMIEENSYSLNSTYAVKLPFQTKIKSTTLNTTFSTKTGAYTLINKDQPAPVGNSLRKRYTLQLTNAAETDHIRNVTVNKSYIYDSDNNVTQEVTDVGSGKEITTVDYANFITAGSWYPNKPQKITTSNIYLSQSPADVRVLDLVYNTTLGHTNYQIYDATANHSIRKDYLYHSGTGVLLKEDVTAPNDTYAPDPTFTSYDYDSKFRFKVKETSPLGYITEQTYEPRFGLVIKTKDLDGLATNMTYDNFGRLKNVVEPGGYITGTDLYWYTASNQLVGDAHPVNAQVVKYFSETKPQGRPTVQTYYDIADRVVKVVEPQFNDLVTYLKDYDINGNEKKQIGPYPVPLIPGVPYLTTTFDYSIDKNELIGVQTTNGTINNNTGIAYSYNTSTGETNVTTNFPDGKFTTERTDATGKLIKIIDAGGNVEHTYNNTGHLSGTLLNGVNVLSNTYDAAGFPSSEFQTNSGTKTFNYNSYGQLKTMTDANGTNFTFTYDELGRLINSTSGLDIYTQSYRNISPGKGQPDVYSVNNNTQMSFVYDNMSRLHKVNEKINTTTYTSTYEYGFLGRLHKKKYPDNFTLKYKYDNQNYLLAIEDESKQEKIWEADDMDFQGNYTAYKKGNVQMNETYNTFGFPTKYYAIGVQNINFDFNVQNGNLKSITDVNKGGIIEEFMYDNLDRLIEAKINQSNPLYISYDTKGNITDKFDGGVLGPHSTKPNQVVAASNPNSDISSVTQDVYYTTFNKVSKITEGINEVLFKYGPTQERIEATFKLNGNVVKRRIYLNECEMDFDATNNLLQTINYVSAPTGLSAIQLTQGSVKNLYFPYVNHLGSILAVTNKNGGLIAEQNFDSWGRRRNASSWSYNSLNSLPSWLYRGYTGHEMLEQFDLINMNGRMYDPKLGRMLSADPVLQPEFGTQAYNKYSYVFNNPLKYADPSGYAANGTHRTFNQVVNQAFFGDQAAAGARMGAEEYSRNAGSGALWSPIWANNQPGEFQAEFNPISSYDRNPGSELSELTAGEGSGEGTSGGGDKACCGSKDPPRPLSTRINDFERAVNKSISNALYAVFGDGPNVGVGSTFHSVAKGVGSLNPMQAVINIGSGILSGRDAYGDKMSGGDYVMNALGVLPGAGFVKAKSWFGWRALSFGKGGYTFDIGFGFRKINGIGFSTRLFLGKPKVGFGLDMHSLYGRPFGSFAHLHLGVPNKFSMGQHIGLGKLVGATFRGGFNAQSVRNAYIR